MKTAIAVLVLAILLVSATGANAQVTSGFVEGQFQIDHNATVVKTMDASLIRPIKPSWTVEAWALKTDGWGEVLVGVGKSLAPWASVSASIGLEESDNLWRTGYSLWLGGRGMSALVLLEAGDSGWWHKVVATKEITPDFELGVMSQRFVGTGPYVAVKIVGKMKTWVTIPLVGGRGALVGVRVGF